jgi:threonine synthase
MKNRILYHSTNRHLNTDEITGFRKKVTFKQALFMGQAPDKGLFMPTRIPRLSKKDILELKGKPYHEVAYEILRRFLSHDIKDKELKAITKDAYNFDIPIEKLDQYTYIVRLDKGPTASFKDFAARLMARLMHKIKPKDKNITVLVATSGDTGSAMGEAYRGLNGIDVHILYPQSEVSPIQKKLLDSIGKNVRTIAIDGKFDDCQKLVKEAFSDSSLKRLNLTSANSINIGRILPQTVYYFYFYVNIVDEIQPALLSIPSGNFGSSLGCEIARRMGLPVKRIILATNENDEFPKLLKSGIYRKVEPSRKCLSNSMNVGNPSNLARYFDLYNGILDKDGIVHKKPNLKEMKKHLYSTAISDEETVKTISRIYKRYKIIVEPHGAVGIAALIKYFKENKKRLSICIETANPAKFPEIIKQKLNISPEIPESLMKIIKRKGKPDYLPNDYGIFKEYLLKKG